MLILLQKKDSEDGQGSNPIKRDPLVNPTIEVLQQSEQNALPQGQDASAEISEASATSESSAKGEHPCQALRQDSFKSTCRHGESGQERIATENSSDVNNAA